jgi:hypothetical protein
MDYDDLYPPVKSDTDGHWLHCLPLQSARFTKQLIMSYEFLNRLPLPTRDAQASSSLIWRGYERMNMTFSTEHCTRPIVETLEQRLLFSADFAPAALGLAVVDGGVEQRTISQGGEFVDSKLQDARSGRAELVLVQTNVPDYQKLVGDILAQAGHGRNIEVVLIDPNQAGITQVTDILSQRQDLAAVHLVAHGADGEVELGHSALNFDTLLKNANAIKSWGRALFPDGDLLIYGCNVAQLDQGKQLIEALSRLTGAGVAASDDVTGAADFGGDWLLEYQVGTVNSAPLLSVAEQLSWHATLGNFAPILDTSKDPTLQPINQNAGPPVGTVGTLVSDLVDDTNPRGGLDNVIDQGSGQRLGVAITAVDSTHGSWYFSTDNGTTWNPLSTPSASSARLLAADANTRLYFQPDVTYSGTLANAITFRAWDQNTGTNGGTGDTTINGGSTAFSTATDTAGFVVFVNRAPVLDSAKQPTLAPINQDARAPVGPVGTLVSQLVDFVAPAGQVDNVSDPDLGARLGIAITGADTSNGRWFYSTDNGSTWNDLGTPSRASSRLLAADANSRLYFQPNPNYTGTIANAITFRAWDQTTGSSGGTASASINGGSTSFSSAVAGPSIAVNRVNTLPLAMQLVPGAVGQDQKIVAEPVASNVPHLGLLDVRGVRSTDTAGNGRSEGLPAGSVRTALSTTAERAAPMTAKFLSGGGDLASSDRLPYSSASTGKQSRAALTFARSPSSSTSAIEPQVNPLLQLINATPIEIAYRRSMPSDWEVAAAFEDDLQDRAQEELRLLLHSVEIGGMALSVGVVLWASRMSAMVGLLLASAPAWRYIDPLPIASEDESDEDNWLEPERADVDAEEMAISFILERPRSEKETA